MNAKERRVIEDMENGGLLHVYVDDDGGTDGSPRYPDWPKPGSGAIVYDGPPTHITERLVRRLHRLGTDWDNSQKAWRLSSEGRVKARALLHGRDVLLIAS